MEDNRFLLTFSSKSFADGKCVSTFNWYESEEEMRADIALHPWWYDFEATEIINCREIEL